MGLDRLQQPLRRRRCPLLHHPADEHHRPARAEALPPGVPMSPTPRPWAPSAPRVVERLQTAFVRAFFTSVVLSLAYVLLALFARGVGAYASEAEVLNL